MGLPRRARRPAVLLLLLAAAGCEACPPEWGYFDVDRHPVGAVPARAGFYVGTYVVAPPVLILGFAIAESATDGRAGDPSWDGLVAAAKGIGLATGLVLGAPFHLLALPFGGGKEEEEWDGGEESGEVPDWDDTPPPVERDYPWPPR